MIFSIRPRIVIVEFCAADSANIAPTTTGGRAPRSYNKIHEPYNWGVFALL